MTQDFADRRGRPRVFVSYSHDSEAHRQRVLDFAEMLRHFGVDAQIDRYVEVPPPRSWPAWMYDEMASADFVIVVCTEGYERRFLGREREGKGRGVRWEGAIITQEAYEENTRRFVPVVLWPNDENHIPYFLRPTTYYSVDVPTRGALEPLLRRLFNEPSVLPAPLGVRPAFPLVSASSVDRTTPAGESPTVGSTGALSLATTKERHEQSRLSFAVDAAIRASQNARAAAPLDEAMLLLRESVQAFAHGFSQHVGKPCRATIYGLEGAPGSTQIVGRVDADLMVRAVAQSSGPDQRAPAAIPLHFLSDLSDVWRESLAVWLNNDVSRAPNYISPRWKSTGPPYRATMAWPIVQRSDRSEGVSTMLGFLTADSDDADVFDLSRDEPIGALYAGILTFVLSDLGNLPR